jgi:hypothetical protein
MATRTRGLETPSEAYSDGEVSFRLPPRRRREVRDTSPEELLTPDSFVVSPAGCKKKSSAEGSSVGEESSSSLRAAETAKTSPETSIQSALQSSSAVQLDAPRVDRRLATIRLPSFDGSTPLDTHLARLQNCSVFYGWTAADRLCHLKASLDGNAASILWELSPTCSEEDLLKILRTRYGDAAQVEKYRFLLRNRRRKRGESLQALYQDICRLLALSYPGETGPLLRVIARDAFLDGLADPEMRIKILEKDVDSIDDAYTVAARYETFLAGSEDGRRSTRAVNSGDSSEADRSWRAEMKDMKSAFGELRAEMQSFMKQAATDRWTSPMPSPSTSAVGAASRWSTEAGAYTSNAAPRATTEPQGNVGNRPLMPDTQRRPRTRGPCYMCNRPGHIARQCPQAVEKATPPADQMKAAQAVSPTDDSAVYADIKLCQGSRTICIPVTFDSGCVLSVLPAKYYKGYLKPVKVQLVAANNTPLSVSGQARVTFFMDGTKLHADTLVSESVDEFLLGYDFLSKNNCKWDIAANKISIGEREFSLRKRRTFDKIRRVISDDNVRLEKRSVTTVPVRLTFCSLHTVASNWIMEPNVAQGRVFIARTLFAHDEHACVKVYNPGNDDVMIKRGLNLGNAEAVTFGCAKCGSVCFCVPETISNESETDDVGIRATVSDDESRCDRAPPAVTAAAPLQTNMPLSCRAPALRFDVASKTDCESELSRMAVSSADVTAIKQRNNRPDRQNCATLQSTKNTVMSSPEAKNTDIDPFEIIRPAYESLPASIDESYREQVKSLLLKYVHCFAKYEYDVGLAKNATKVRFQLKDPSATPVAEPLRPHPVAYLDAIDEEVAKLESAGIIQKCANSKGWCHNLVLVKRKPVDGQPAKLRVTTDLRQLNSKIVGMPFPSVDMRLVWMALAGAKYITSLDFANAYFSMPLDEETAFLTTFCTRRGLWTYSRLPQGCSLSGAVFTQFIQGLFSDMLWVEILAFLDDLTIPSKDVAQGIEILAKVLKRVEDSGLRLKAKKCKILQTETIILGMKICDGEMSQDPARISAIKALQFPRTIRELRQFLGFAGFARAFYKNFAETASPLIACLKKGACLKRTPETLGAFEKLQNLMTESPVLTLFDPSCSHSLEVDASQNAWGSVLYQTDNAGVQHIVSYASGTFSDVQKRYCTTRREVLGIILSLKHFKNFLIGRKITIFSDHCALKYLQTSRQLSDQWSRYLDFLSDFSFDIQWKPGKDMKISDFLSRPCDSKSARCKQCRPKGKLAPESGEAGELRGPVRLNALDITSRCHVTPGVVVDQYNSPGDFKATTSGTMEATQDDIPVVDGLPAHACTIAGEVAELSEMDRSPHVVFTGSSGVADLSHCLPPVDCDLAADVNRRENEKRFVCVDNPAFATPLSSSFTSPAQSQRSTRKSGYAGATPVESVARDSVVGVGVATPSGGNAVNNNDEPDRVVRTSEVAVAHCGGVSANCAAKSLIADVSAANYTDEPVIHNSSVYIDKENFVRVCTRSQANRSKGTGRRKREKCDIGMLPSAELTELWSADQIIKGQESDPAICLLKSWLNAGKKPIPHEIEFDSTISCYYEQFASFVIIENIVYRKFFATNGEVQHYQLVMPASMKTSFLELIHEKVMCHARTFHKNLAAITPLAFWPTWRHDTRLFLDTCRRCLECGSKKPPRQGMLRPTGGSLSRPSQQISIDLTGPHPLSLSRYKYCLSVQDCFSKYLSLYPLPDKTASSVARALSEYFLTHGLVSYVKMDNGGEFKNEIVSDLHRLFRTVEFFTIPYFPRQNPVERAHRTINSMISRVVDEHRSWAEIMPYLAFCYNSMVHKSTNFTPHYLHFGRNLASSADALLRNPEAPVDNNACTYGQFAADVNQRMATAYAIARDVLRTQANFAKRYYDKKVHPQNFQVGDVVLIHSPRPKTGCYPKWQRYYDEEATVCAKVNDVIYLVRLSRSGIKKILHVDKMKLLHRDDKNASSTGQNSESEPGQL